MIKNVDEIHEAPVLDFLQNAYATVVPLKRAGVNYVGCCPFHNEKSASFTVNSDKNIWKCFGCGKAGSGPVSFAKDYEKLTYPEALKKVADHFHIEIDYENPAKAAVYFAKQKEESEKKAEFFALLTQVHEEWLKVGRKFPCSRWDSDSEGNACIEVDVWGRSYTVETLEAFGVCTTPDGNMLVNMGIALGEATEARLKALALVAQTEKGKYDFFRNRLIFPWYDENGKIVGFAGRKPPEDTDPKHAKYKNSKEDDMGVFSKGKLLWGLHQTKKYIVNSDRERGGKAMIVEGYTDALTMFDNGFRNVVATGGTALTVEQAKRLKKYCREVVVIRDADDAGQEAARRDVQILTEIGLFVKVLPMPKTEDGKKHDPDSFIREHGRLAFDALLTSDAVQDGIYWRIRQDLGEAPDQLARDIAGKTAARLLSFVDEFNRGGYVKALVSIKWLNCEKRIIEEAISDALIARKPVQRYSDLTAKQERDSAVYGVYIGPSDTGKGDIYWKKEKSQETALTNFIIIARYHIASEINPARKILIRNEHGHSCVLDVHTDDFEDFGKFKKTCAAKGNFKFKGHCKAADFSGITEKIYDDCRSVHRISTLGLHPVGFWTWSNGVSLMDGNFLPPQVDGTFDFEGNSFMIPGFDAEEEEHRKLHDDKRSLNSHIGLYKFAEGEMPDFERWCQLMFEVYGDNGLVGIGYYLAALNRDIIYPILDAFPHLNLFGPPQKGKNTFGLSLMSLFGQPRQPFLFDQVTLPALSDFQTETRNCIVWGDEYSNQIDPRLQQAIKGMSDGTGRNKKSMAVQGATETTTVNNALMISGQDAPTYDIALLTRCITLEFNYTKDSSKEKLLEELRTLESTGRLTQFTGMLQKHRDEVKARFNRIFSECRDEMAPQITSNKARIIRFHAVPLTMVVLLESLGITFPKIKGEPLALRLKGFLEKLIEKQSQNVDSEDETTDFWRRVFMLSQAHQIKHKANIIVEDAQYVRVAKPGTKSDTEELQFPEGFRKLVFIHLDSVFFAYEQSYKGAKKQGLSKMGIETYLTQSDAYLGKVRSKKFGYSGLQAFVFQADKLPLDFPLTSLVLAKMQPEPEGASGDGEGVLSEEEVAAVFGEKIAA
jgi:DNA primase catalytic core